MEAIICWTAEGVDWEPNTKLKAVFHELWDMKEWLVATQGVSVLQAPPDRSGKQQVELGARIDADQVAMPKKTNRQ